MSVWSPRANTGSVGGKWYAIYANKDITISGDGKLVVSAIGNSSYGIRSETGSVTITDDSNLDIALNVYMLGIRSGKNTTISGNGAVTITSSMNADGVRSDGDITISGSAKVTSAPFDCFGDNVIFSGSGDVQIVGVGTQGPNAIYLGNPDAKVLLNGTAESITLKGSVNAIYLSGIYDNETRRNAVAGTNFDKYEVTGDPASPSVVYTFIGNSYDVWVGNVQVTDANKDNVLGDGTVSYDPLTNTVTLNGAQITKASKAGAIYATDALTVNVVGDSSITLDSSVRAQAIYTVGDLVPTGSRNLEICVESDHTGIEVWGDVTISGSGDVTVSAGEYGIFIIEDSMGSLILSGSGKVDIYGKCSGVLFWDDDSKLQLDGTCSSITLRAGEYKAVCNGNTQKSPVAGTNFDKYEVTGDPASDSVVYTYKGAAETLLGDVNNDGRVNQKDVARLRQYIADSTSYPLDAKQNADVNKDGKINQKDVARLRQYIADPTTYPLG